MIDFEEHLTSSSDNRLVVAFAGGPQNVYQFGASLRALGISHVLMRDTTQRYHGHGVAGIGDRDAVIDYLRNWVRAGFAVITTGVSSGAYPALLYGQLTPVQRIIVFSPLTGREVDDLAPGLHWHVHDPAWQDMVDLRDHFRDGPIPQTRAFISDDPVTCLLDRHMCERVNIAPEDITLIPGYAHADLARALRDKGMFKELFK